MGAVDHDGRPDLALFQHSDRLAHMLSLVVGLLASAQDQVAVLVALYVYVWLAFASLP